MARAPEIAKEAPTTRDAASSTSQSGKRSAAAVGSVQARKLLVSTHVCRSL